MHGTASQSSDTLLETKTSNTTIVYGVRTVHSVLFTVEYITGVDNYGYIVIMPPLPLML